jgi:hypothetical protein
MSGISFFASLPRPCARGRMCSVPCDGCRKPSTPPVRDEDMDPAAVALWQAYPGGPPEDVHCEGEV